MKPMILSGSPFAIDHAGLFAGWFRRRGAGRAEAWAERRRLSRAVAAIEAKVFSWPTVMTER
jgi:hypothetical protein